MAFDIKKYCYAANPLEQRSAGEIEYKYEGLNLFFIEEGECVITSKFTTLTVKSGEIVCCPDKLVLKFSKGSSSVGINLTGIIPEKYSKDIQAPFVANSIFMPFLPQNLTQLVVNFNSLSEHYISNLVFELVSTLSRGDKKSVISNQIVSEAIGLIKQNYTEIYGVEELAQTLQISKSHLVREFFKHTGTTPGKYLINVRIDAVKQLLTQTSLPLNTIAVKTGFSGDNYLCKAFKKVTGETPMAYKSRIISSQYLPNQMTLPMNEIYN